MPTHGEKRFLPYEPWELYDLVADVEKYPKFLPWCLASRIKKREGDVFYADLVIGFKMVRERFTSRVQLTSGNRIDVSYAEGPFQYLNNHWIFEKVEGGTVIDFYVDFEFKSVFLQRIMGALFNEAVRRMVAAFERRAEQLYGRRPAQPGGAPPPRPRPSTSTT